MAEKMRNKMYRIYILDKGIVEFKDIADLMKIIYSLGVANEWDIEAIMSQAQWIMDSK